MLDLIAVLFQLSAEFLKARRDEDVAVTSAEFQEWLQDEAFPKLLAQSDQTLRSVLTLRATEHERFQAIMDQLLQIKAAVALPTAEDRWALLRPTDRDILKFVCERAVHDPFVNIEGKELQGALLSNPEDIYTSAKYLDGMDLLGLGQSSGGWWVAAEPSAIELVTQVSSPGKYEAARARVAKALPRSDQAGRLKQIAEDSKTPIGLTYCILKQWADSGQLRFEKDSSPWEYATVWDVSEVLRRRHSLA